MTGGHATALPPPSFIRRNAAALAAAAAAAILGLVLFLRGVPLPAPADLPEMRWHVELTDPGLSSTRLERTFSDLGYDLARAREGGPVPRILIGSMPVDLSRIRVVERRKTLFLAAVLPLVLAVNEDIAADRAILTAIDARLKAGEAPDGEALAELDRLGRYYRLIDDDTDEDSIGEPDLGPRELVATLLRRVAPVPVSLALAQAAEESAWGMSRFATEGNALYGQWTWNDAAGIVPAARAQNATHSVRAFAGLLQSTESYMRNLNTHWAYAGFRNARMEMLNRGDALDGMALAGTLLRYSSRGEAYVKSLRTIIAANGLQALDHAVLAPAGAQVRMAAAGPG